MNRKLLQNISKQQQRPTRTTSTRMTMPATAPAARLGFFVPSDIGLGDALANCASVPRAASASAAAARSALVGEGVRMRCGNHTGQVGPEGQ